MLHSGNRRHFLAASATGSLAAFSGPFDFLHQLPRLSAADVKVSPDLVQFQPEIEPLVRLIEETPRPQLLEQIANRIRSGTSYHEVLAALLLAGIRNVQPRPSVGHKFHSVLCVNSCHLASQTGPDEDRWLPIFWALDYFKGAQAEESSKSGWRMKPVSESQLPMGAQAHEQFISAMEQWDVEKADVAVAGLVRSSSANDVFRVFAQFAARDFRSIGHKAIFLANSWRTLEVIGWKYAEPVMRSLAFAMLNAEGSQNPARADLPADRPWRQNQQLLQKDWSANGNAGKIDQAATRELITLFRTVDPHAAAVSAADMMQKGVAGQSVWDAVFVGSGELLMRQPGIVTLHGLTTANAVHYLWQNVDDEQLRLRLLWQACSFNTMFRDAAGQRGALKAVTIDQFEPVEPKNTTAPGLETIFASVSADKSLASQQVREYLAAGGTPEQLIAGARRMIFSKSRDAHDYKFTSAVLEDAEQLSPAWRDTYLALTVYQLRGTGDRDNPVLDRMRRAFA